MSVIFNMENLDVLRMEIYHNHQKPFCVVCLTVKITRQNNVIRIRELSPCYLHIYRKIILNLLT